MHFTQNMSPTARRGSSRECSAGFTLIEALCSLTVLAVMMFGVMNLYVGALRLESRTQADAYTGEAGANGLRQIAESAREGLYYLLPQETLTGNAVSFTTSLAKIGASGNAANTSNPASRFANYTAANFTNTNSSGAVCYTGAFIAYPAVTTAINIVTSTGVAPTTAVTPYDATGTSTTYVLFFRSDSSGNPLPATGTYLWETGTVNGQIVDKAVVKTIDTNAWNAVEFDRPVNPSTSTVIWSQIQVKIVTGAYSAQNGVNTNEATNGSNDDITVGKTILLRDFDQSGHSNLNSNTPVNSTSARFQAS